MKTTVKNRRGRANDQIALMRAKGYWSASDLAEKLRVGTNTIYRRCDAGRYESLLTDGHHYVLLKSVRADLGDESADLLLGKGVGL